MSPPPRIPVRTAQIPRYILDEIPRLPWRPPQHISQARRLLIVLRRDLPKEVTHDTPHPRLVRVRFPSGGLVRHGPEAAGRVPYATNGPASPAPAGLTCRGSNATPGSRKRQFRTSQSSLRIRQEAKKIQEHRDGQEPLSSTPRQEHAPPPPR